VKSAAARCCARPARFAAARSNATDRRIDEVSSFERFQGR
jgi:hypothetical protein